MKYLVGGDTKAKWKDILATCQWVELFAKSTDIGRIIQESVPIERNVFAFECVETHETRSFWSNRMDAPIGI